MRHNRLDHHFVELIPETLEPGILYISVRYATAVHLCCCGCGSEVVTPFTPTDWRLIFDGETISLLPSIGSWNLPCRSHYYLTNGNVIPARAWSDKAVFAEQKRDRRAKQHYYSLRLPDKNPNLLGESGRAPNRNALVSLFKLLFGRHS